MTNWEWSVILALCRLVLRFYIPSRQDVPIKDIGLLQEALKREEK